MLDCRRANASIASRQPAGVLGAREVRDTMHKPKAGRPGGRKSEKQVSLLPAWSDTLLDDGVGYRFCRSRRSTLIGHAHTVN